MKTPKNTLDELARAEADLVFLPSPAHRAAKSKFWSRYEDFGDGAESISLSKVTSLVNDPAISKWWKLDGFKDWFLNKDEARERLEYLYMLALDAAEGLLLNPDANHNAKVQAIKVVANLAGKEPSKNERYADEDIQKMDEKQLRRYIEKKTPKLIVNKNDTQGD